MKMVAYYCEHPKCQAEMDVNGVCKGCDNLNRVLVGD